VPFWRWSTSQQRSWLLERTQDFIANEGGEFNVTTTPPPQGSGGPPLQSSDGGAGDGDRDGESGSGSGGFGATAAEAGGGRGMGLLYVITVRNPLDRVLSHFRHERASPKVTEDANAVHCAAPTYFVFFLPFLTFSLSFLVYRFLRQPLCGL